MVGFTQHIYILHCNVLAYFSIQSLLYVFQTKQSLTMITISLEELHLFHKIDREIFSRLVLKLMRDPAQSLLVMAIWLWLEDKRFLNIVVKMLTLPNIIVNALANEAVLCLKCLEGITPNNNIGGLPLTTRVIGREISLQSFAQNRFTAIRGIKTLLNNVCSRVFTDILQLVLPGSSLLINFDDPIILPGFPHPVFGNVNIVNRPMDYDIPTGGLWGWDQVADDGTEEDRTMFLTFSRGFPVFQQEVRDLFTNMFSDMNCVRSVRMGQGSSENEQAILYAKMILSSVTFVDRILNGERIAKFKINGKHIWARKYERRG